MSELSRAQDDISLQKKCEKILAKWWGMTGVDPNVYLYRAAYADGAEESKNILAQQAQELATMKRECECLHSMGANQAQTIARLERENLRLNSQSSSDMTRAGCLALELSEVKQQLAASQARCREMEEAERALIRKGYRKQCDIPACNCGPQWNHGGHAEARLNEIDEVLPWVNGQTILMRVDNLVAENANLTAERDAAVQEAERLRSVLKKIAKPALGGKQQQWMAQEALKGA